MKLFLAFACLLAGCLAQKPHPCKSPPLLTGGFSVFAQNDDLFGLGKYLYDAIGERIRVFELVTLDNQTFTYDVLANYREQVLYQINEKDKTCQKSPLKANFMPMGVPPGSSLVAQSVLGDSSRPGEGLLVNTWTGNQPNIGRFMTTVTEFGCIPVTFVYQLKPYGWMHVSYFDNVIGITNPDQLNPPSFCSDANTMTHEEPVDFMSLFQPKN
ncbi:ependymin [Labrus bergylta]|uniref:ependymin n=1 Tax=Labrus bergylta TaxID=56723 RepID=UPI0009B305F1|nr:ependymin-like [Labrus bergylta]